MKADGVGASLKGDSCVRDKAARHDPEAADQAFGEMIAMFRGVTGG
jgi:hypothetical protein